MSNQLEIKPGVGLSQLLFGADMNEAESAFGKPEDTEVLDDPEDCHAIVWHYWEEGFTLFFDERDNSLFNCVEIDHPGTLLWGELLFDLDESAVIELFKKKGFEHFETEVHDWGEKRISFDDANIDLYFEKNKLCSVNYGRAAKTSTNLILPN